MALGAVGEDQATAGQAREPLSERIVSCQPVQRDLVHLVEELARVHAVVGHQAGQGGAVLVVVALLQRAGLDRPQADAALDEGLHAVVDQGEQVALGRIEGVVEVEDPGVDMGEIRGQVGSRSGEGAAAIASGPYPVSTGAVTACGAC